MASNPLVSSHERLTFVSNFSDFVVDVEPKVKVVKFAKLTLRGFLWFFASRAGGTTLIHADFDDVDAAALALASRKNRHLICEERFVMTQIVRERDHDCTRKWLAGTCMDVSNLGEREREREREYNATVRSK